MVNYCGIMCSKKGQGREAYWFRDPDLSAALLVYSQPLTYSCVCQLAMYIHFSREKWALFYARMLRT